MLEVICLWLKMIHHNNLTFTLTINTKVEQWLPFISICKIQFFTVHITSLNFCFIYLIANKVLCRDWHNLKPSLNTNLSQPQIQPKTKKP